MARQEWAYDDLNRAGTRTVMERVLAPAVGPRRLGWLTSQTSPLKTR